MRGVADRCHLGGLRRSEARLARQDRRHLRGQGIAAELTLLARGRDADVYALDDTTVLRRYRRRDVPDEEVAIIHHVHSAGFPTPAVIGVHGPDLILERVAGQTMRADIERDPSLLRAHARALAGLHQRLHRITPPEWLRSIGPGDAIVHLDLHPENVLMTERGPQVIDWANARRGHWADDVAQTLVILRSAVSDPAVAPLADAVRSFSEFFLAEFDRDGVRAHLAAAVARRAADQNVTDDERAALRDYRI